MDVVVADANTLIYLAQSDLLDLLQPYKVLVTEVVYKETVEQGKDRDKSDAYLLEDYIEEKCERRSVNEEKLEKESKYFGARGEASVYVLADQRDLVVITTDMAALKKMRKKDVEAIRTDTVLLKQFKNGRLGLSEFRDKISRFSPVGGTTEHRINVLMQKAEEFKRGDKK